MKTRYSKTTGNFYPISIDYPNFPADVIQVDQADYEAAMNRPADSTFSFDASGVLTITAAPAPTLDQLKAAKIAEANSTAQILADQLTAGYPDFERATWRDQQVEALAWNADNTKPTPYIDALALQRGIDRVTYLQKTVTKVTSYQASAQKLVGQRQKYVDQINAVTTAAALDAIVINYVLS